MRSSLFRGAVPGLALAAVAVVVVGLGVGHAEAANASTDADGPYYDEVCRVEDVKCTSWVLGFSPGFNHLSGFVRVLVFAGVLAYLFLGIAVISDSFLLSIQKITSQEYKTFKEVNGQIVKVQYKVWNPTVANLTLLGLGSSAPEILLALVDILTHLSGPCSSSSSCAHAHAQVPPTLGTATIVGAAMFNLTIVSAICMVSVPRGQGRTIEDISLYRATLLFAVFAYLWLALVMLWVTPGRVDNWEAWMTLAWFVVMVVTLYFASGNSKSTGRGRAHRLTDVELQAAAYDQLTDGASSESDENATPRQLDDRARSRALREVRKWVRDGNGEEGDLDALEMLMARVPRRQTQLTYRVNATRKMIGRGRLLHNQSTVGMPALHNTTARRSPGVLTFRAAEVTVMEGCGFASLVVQRTGGCDGEVSVDFFTSDGTAVAKEHYTPCKGTLKFGNGISEKTIRVQIIDNDQMEDDKTLLVSLARASGGAMLGKQRVCSISIIDDDSPGVVQFQAQSTFVSVNENSGLVEVVVERLHGASGTVAVDYLTRNGSAVAGEDYEPTYGTLVFDSGEREKVIRVRIIDDEEVEDNETFNMLLSNPRGNPPPLLGSNRCCQVTIIDNDASMHVAQRLVGIVEKQSARLSMTTSTWREQFVDAVTLRGEVDVAGNELPPTSLDYALHIFAFGWKILCACIPPTEFLGGWLAFVVSLLIIAFLTATLGAFASLFGCMLHLTDSVVAVTFVSFGVTMPDVIAAVQAASHGSNADVAIGHIGSSVGVNAFLGLGLPWVLATLYHDIARTDAYKVDIDDLNGFVYFTLATLVVYAGMMAVRRRAGAELGGTKQSNQLSASVLIGLWVVFVIVGIALAVDEY